MVHNRKKVEANQINKCTAKLSIFVLSIRRSVRSRMTVIFLGNRLRKVDARFSVRKKRCDQKIYRRKSVPPTVPGQAKQGNGRQSAEWQKAHRIK